MSTHGAVASERGTRASWDQLVALRADAMHFAGWLGVPGSSREDVVQTALLRVLPHAASLDKPSSLKAYLLSTVRNLWRNECRRDRLGRADDLTEIDVIDLSPTPDERLVLECDYSAAREAYDALPSQHREVIRLRYLDALTYEDVAGRLGITEVTARQRLHRARKVLSAEFDREQRGTRHGIIDRRPHELGDLG